MWRSSKAWKADSNGVLIKSSEGDVGTSDKGVRGIGSGRDLPAVRIVRQSTRIDIEALA